MTNSRIVQATDLPDVPNDAAAAFYARVAPEIRAGQGSVESVVVCFAPADYTHDDWRLAAIRGLARELAPCRVNGVAGSPDGLQAMAATLRFLDDSPGITGQLFALDGVGAGNPAN